MSDVAVIQKATLYEMADAIIDTTGRTEDFKVRDFPNLIRNEVYGAGYEKGYEEGVENAKPVLYGTYLLKKNIDYSWTNDVYGSFGEYAFYYITRDVQNVYRAELQFIAFEQNGITIYPTPNYDTHLYYSVEKGYWELVQTVDDAGVTAEPFPNESCRILEFTEPFEVSKEFYDLLMSIVDNADGTAYGIGHTEGKKAEYDKFWDAFQHYGERTYYPRAFLQWGDAAFYPKYDIIATSNSSAMFESAKIKNLRQRLIDCGVTLDVSQVTDVTYMFSVSSVTHAPIIDASSSRWVDAIFYNSGIVDVEKLILKSDGSQTIGDAFKWCFYLQNIVIEGTIGQNGLSFQWASKLSKNSIYSVMNALSTTTSGLSITLSLTAVQKAFESGLNYNDGATTREFLALRNSRSNWTINMV